jgi:3-amino-5-hydroxybenzoate synthase
MADASDESVDVIAARCPNTEQIHSDCVWLHHRTLLGTEQQMHEIAAVLADVLAG